MMMVFVRDLDRKLSALCIRIVKRALIAGKLRIGLLKLLALLRREFLKYVLMTLNAKTTCSVGTKQNKTSQTM